MNWFKGGGALWLGEVGSIVIVYIGSLPYLYFDEKIKTLEAFLAAMTQQLRT